MDDETIVRSEDLDNVHSVPLNEMDDISVNELACIPSHAWPATFVVFSAVFFTNFDELSTIEVALSLVASAALLTIAVVLSANVLVTFSVLLATDDAVSFVDFHADSPVFSNLSTDQIEIIIRTRSNRIVVHRIFKN